MVLAENKIFAPYTAEQELHDSRTHSGSKELTPEKIDYEMQFPHSDSEETRIPHYHYK